MAGTYLRECLIENVGPIGLLDLSCSFNSDGTPKPIILVGPNGSGKTVFLAHVVDALTELAKKAYRDTVLPGTRYGSPYFKITGGTNVRSGAPFGHCLLTFAGGGREFGYGEHAGSVPEGHAKGLLPRFPAITPPNVEAAKRTTGTEKDVEAFFRDSAVCFFPSSRHEKPHWLNPASVSDVPVYAFDDRYIGELGKPIVVESAGDATRQWLMDVVLDSLAEVEVGVRRDPGVEPVLYANVIEDLADKVILKRCRDNVDRILGLILQDSGAALTLGYRGRADGRLAVARTGGAMIPSLSHLSAGQSILLNCFATILRYSDRSDVGRSANLDQVEGLVLVDEVDSHLHTALQYEVLPALCKLFPRVQFIVTSHSPLFLLGMEAAYGAAGIQLIEMPDGASITTERFSEFRDSFEYYRRTKSFEERVAGDVKALLGAGSKPLVLTEGKIDARYIHTALDLRGRRDLLARLDVACVGTAGATNASGSGSGKGSLDTAFAFLRDNPQFLSRPVLLLYDHDTNKKPAGGGRLMIRVIPHVTENTRMKKGIENLFPDTLFDEEGLTERFVREKQRETDYVVSSTIREFDKQAFCDWMCDTRRRREDFAGFGSIVHIMEEFLADSSSG